MTWRPCYPQFLTKGHSHEKLQVLVHPGRRSQLRGSNHPRHHLLVPEWSAAFDADDELVSKSSLLLTAGCSMALVLGFFGLYGLSGGRVIQRLPLLRLGLLVIGLIYTLRGIAFVPQFLMA